MSNGSSPFRPDDLQRYREASNALENTRSQVEALEQTATVETFNRQLDLLRRRLLNDPQAFRDMFISDGTAAIVAEFKQDEQPAEDDGVQHPEDREIAAERQRHPGDGQYQADENEVVIGLLPPGAAQEDLWLRPR